MRVTAKADYAVRALVELASAPDRSAAGAELAARCDIPERFLRGILGDLRRSGLVRAQRGADGGYRLARPSEDITIGEVIRAVEGPIADVRGIRPPDLDYRGSAVPLQRVWVASRAALRSVLDSVSLRQVAEDALPEVVGRLADEPSAWR